MKSICQVVSAKLSLDLEMSTKPIPGRIQPAMTAAEIALALGSNQKRITYEINYALDKFKTEFEKRGFKLTDLMDPQ